jgi:hypothetical protein
MISSLNTDKAIKAALQILPSGLTATYENILLSTLKRHAIDIDDIKTTLQWLVASVVPLTASQLAEIMSISPEDKSIALQELYGPCPSADLTYITHSVPTST